MALPTTNITTTIVRNELGVATNNVGGLCTHPNVNMFSRKKPVRVPGNPANWFEADNFGIVLPTWVRGTEQYWTYNKPRGGANEPYRLGDFRGYYHEAGNPILLQNVDGMNFNLMNSTTVSLSSIVAQQPSDIVITYHDVAPGYFFAVEVESHLGTRQWRTSETGNVSIDFSASPFLGNEWRNGPIKLRFFFSSKEKNSFANTDVSGELRKALHSETARPTNQEINLVMTTSVECEITGVASELQPSEWATGATELPQPGQTLPLPGQGFVVNKSHYGLSLRCRFRSKENGSVVVGGSNFSFGVSSNWWGVPKYMVFDNRMYNLNGTSRANIIAPVGSWSDEVILYDTGVFNWDGTNNVNPSPNAKNVFLSIRQSGMAQTLTVNGISKWIT